MEEIHSRFLISDELKLYTLATVMLEPDRLAMQFGVNPFSPVDREARWNFWCGIAREMGLELPAQTREGFLDWMLAYEDAQLRKAPPTRRGCYEGLVEDWLSLVPVVVAQARVAGSPVASGLLDPKLREAMGVEAPPKWIQTQVNLVPRTYLKSTPYRVFRKDRNLINFFGKDRANPRDLAPSDTYRRASAPAAIARLTLQSEPSTLRRALLPAASFAVKVITAVSFFFSLSRAFIFARCALVNLNWSFNLSLGIDRPRGRPALDRVLLCSDPVLHDRAGAKDRSGPVSRSCESDQDPLRPAWPKARSRA